MAATPALREVLNEGISSGNFIDTKIILYSRRDSRGHVCQPKALYANSHVLKTAPHFKDCECPIATATLEEPCDTVLKVLSGDFAESQPEDLSEPNGEGESVDDYGYLSDSDLEDDEEPPEANPSLKSDINREDNGDENKFPCEFHQERVEKCKVIRIPDMAFVTFQAFLMYLYTNTMAFAQFGSEKNRRSRGAETLGFSDNEIPLSSPKSIYRLAHKYGVPALKTLALDHIRGAQPWGSGVVEKEFNRFDPRYPEIASLYATRLDCVFADDSTGERVEKKISEGDLGHAVGPLSTWQDMRDEDRNVGTSLTVNEPEALWFGSPTRWKSVETALIKSIYKGVFFDRKYWARYSKAGDAFKPIYFSSIIMDDEADKLKKLVKYHKSQSTPIDNLEGHVDVESDCDGDPPEAREEDPTMREENQEQGRAILLVGSFSAWKSLFFYCCTDEISFAPIKSLGDDSRLKYIRENTVAAAPPPCSPKSIFILAGLLEIYPLRYGALLDIERQMNLDHIEPEHFPWVTTIREKTVKTACERLISVLREKSIEIVPCCSTWEVPMPTPRWKTPFDFKALPPSVPNCGPHSTETPVGSGSPTSEKPVALDTAGDESK